MASFSDHLDLSMHRWLTDESLTRILHVIAAAGGEARIVGGAVRDALLGRDVKEIDLAVNLPPDAVAAILSTAHIKTVPTGIEHGTLTAVVDHKTYEITSLRRDIETDGRHATVTFTHDWREDAARRDFTFNALYADVEGVIYDYFNGRADLAAGLVRFIGQPQQRIQEDILRILRFFRFYAWFGKGLPDAEGLAACRELASHIPQLSVERVWREITKLLAAPDPVASWKLMQQNFILAQILAEADNIQVLEKIIQIEKTHRILPSSLRRFAALLPQQMEAARQIAQRLKLSNKEALSLQQLAILPKELKNRLNSGKLPEILYEYDAESVCDAALLLATTDFTAESSLKMVLEACKDWQRPVFPLRGEDLLQLKVKAGPQIGIMLRSIEVWWVQQNFIPDHKACLDEARKMAAPTS